jgi:hypothetical protein
MKIVKWFTMVFCFLLLYSCKKKQTPDPPLSNEPNIENTLGFGILSKLNGIWSGPVTSTTALGNFSEWVVDFRPISAGQVSAKNELDPLNDIFLSFFIVKHNNNYKVAFRNGGNFAGMKRVTYLLADSVSESSSQSYYRFSEAVQGKSRAYSEVLFRNDSIYLTSYTNMSLHMKWSAKLQCSTAYQSALSNFNFPQKILTKDFSTTFDGLIESIYFSTTNDPPVGDPFPESAQPYLGQTTASFTFSSSYIPDPNKNVLILCTTQPIFSGFSLDQNALKTKSRYVILSSSFSNYVFNYMHPGTYYYYALYDSDGNNTFNSGDWVSSSNTTFNLSASGNQSVSTQINFTIP